MPTPKLLTLAGSLRKGSFNKKLARVAADAARAAGAEVTLIDLADFRMPVYDGDLEAAEGVPEPAKKLNRIFRDHHALLIACPEYNSSVPGMFKNVIDWISRPEPGEPELAAFAGKVAALMSASPGQLGGLRALVHLRSILGNIKVLVLPEQLTLPKAAEAFDDSGNLKDPKKLEQIHSLAKRLVHLTASLMT